MISHNYSRSIFKYEDGMLIWLESRKGAKHGKEAGTLNSNGYKRVSIDYKLYYVHQLVYLFHHGVMPLKVDHIDGNRLNNKIENLRGVTSSQNSQNSSMRSDNTTGYRGVSRTRNNKFRAYITVDKKQLWLGVFDKAEDAYKQYQIANKKFFGEFSRI